MNTIGGSSWHERRRRELRCHLVEICSTRRVGDYRPGGCGGRYRETTDRVRPRSADDETRSSHIASVARIYLRSGRSATTRATRRYHGVRKNVDRPLRIITAWTNARNTSARARALITHTRTRQVITFFNFLLSTPVPSRTITITIIIICFFFLPNAVYELLTHNTNSSRVND